MLANSREPSSALQRKYVAAQTTTVAQAGQDGRLNLFGAILENNTASDVFLQLFDKAAAGTVTLGVTVPDQTVRIPASGAVILDQIMPVIHCVLGLRFAVTTTRTGNTAPATGATVTLYFSQQ